MFQGSPIDVSPAYIQAVQELVAQALIVFDHVRVIKLYNDRLSNLRRQLLNQIEEPRKTQVIKVTRWLLMKNPENLNTDRLEPDRFKAALKLNQPLAAAYYMKEDLHQIYGFRYDQFLKLYIIWPSIRWDMDPIPEYFVVTCAI